mmetsp:Transcript_149726/g.261640  ORF Transcript_149726/g.261640 Transcript_149726/m.261640 type:complete len:100 (-) Transcript_149726:644-943(-)
MYVVSVYVCFEHFFESESVSKKWSNYQVQTIVISQGPSENWAAHIAGPSCVNSFDSVLQAQLALGLVAMFASSLPGRALTIPRGRDLSFLLRPILPTSG